MAVEKSNKLLPFQAPAIQAVPACAGCGAFQPECLVPHGEGALAMCWLCAHAHVDHGVELDKTVNHECECLPTDIYPERVLEARRERSRRS